MKINRQIRMAKKVSNNEFVSLLMMNMEMNRRMKKKDVFEEADEDGEEKGWRVTMSLCCVTLDSSPHPPRS